MADAVTRRSVMRLNVWKVTWACVFHRTTRSVLPTEVGRILIERLGPAFPDIGSALDQATSHGNRAAGSLKFNVPPSAARLVLPRVVPAFLMAYPDIRLEIVTDENFIDIIESGCDAGIRYDERLEHDMIAVPIGRASSALRLRHHQSIWLREAPRKRRRICWSMIIFAIVLRVVRSRPGSFNAMGRWCSLSRPAGLLCSPVGPPIWRSRRRRQGLVFCVCLKIG